MMTQAAQAALRRGKLQYIILTVANKTMRFSDRTVHPKRPILHHLQLCEQDHTSNPIPLHSFSLQSITYQSRSIEAVRRHRK